MSCISRQCFAFSGSPNGAEFSGKMRAARNQDTKLGPNHGTGTVLMSGVVTSQTDLEKVLMPYDRVENGVFSVICVFVGGCLSLGITLSVWISGEGCFWSIRVDDGFG